MAVLGALMAISLVAGLYPGSFNKSWARPLAADLIYILGDDRDSISGELMAVDAMTGQVAKRVKLGMQPQAVLSADKRWLYVVDSNLIDGQGVFSALKRIDAATLEVVQEVSIDQRRAIPNLYQPTIMLTGDDSHLAVQMWEATGDSAGRAWVNLYDASTLALVGEAPAACHEGRLAPAQYAQGFVVACADRFVHMELKQGAWQERAESIDPGAAVPNTGPKDLQTAQFGLGADRSTGMVYLVNSKGEVKQAQLAKKEWAKRLTLAFAGERSVPFQGVRFAANSRMLFVGSGLNNHRFGGTIDRIDVMAPARGKLMNQITLPEPAVAFAVSSDGTHVYALAADRESGHGHLFILRGDDGALVKQLDLPSAVAVDLLVAER